LIIQKTSLRKIKKARQRCAKICDRYWTSLSNLLVRHCTFGGMIFSQIRDDVKLYLSAKDVVVERAP